MRGVRVRTSVFLHAVVGLALAGWLPLAAQAAPRATNSRPSRQDTTANQDASTRLLQRSVSLDLRDVPLSDALEEIDRQAQLGLAYSPKVVPLTRRVTIQAAKITAGQALERVLEGTGARAVESVDGTVYLTRAAKPIEESSATPAASLGIWGQVTDSSGRRPLAGAQVMVQNTSLLATTNDSGFYGIRGVPAGRHTVIARLIGYAPVTREVEVPAADVVRLDFALRSTATRLNDIVTTATGEQRRLELGNDITVINADSIVRTQPIHTVTDLLEGRVPGLVVQRTSGAPGDPARLRLRGTSSPQLSNDPIVIVDGVRVYSAQSDSRGGNLAGTGRAADNYAAPSPLDYIDPNTVERIEVVKGPSAATLYGQDAASGVVVITTKRGQAGPTRWTMSAERGRSVTPGRYPDLYLRWGHRVVDNTQVMCSIAESEGSYACVPDSLRSFQLLNEPDLSILTPGHRSALTLGVSGGSNALTYAVNGSYVDELGQMQLPTYEVDRFQTLHDAAPPDWMQRPQGLTRWGATSRVSARLGSDADVSLTAGLSRTEQRRSALERQLGDLMITYLDRASGTYYRGDIGGVITEAQNVLSAYYERAKADATEFTNAVNVNWRPLSWLTTSADAGLNIVQRADEIFLPRGLSTFSDSIGRLGLGQGRSVVSTVNLRATAQTPLFAGFNFRFSAGFNYTGQSVADLVGSAEGLAEGTSSLNGAARITGLSEQRLDQRTFGWYLEPSFSHKRVWFSTGLRLDGGSTFGTKVKLPAFPKLSFSYLVSDEPWFPKSSFLTALRLRVAYGHAGRQPGVADRLRLFSARAPVWVGDHFADGSYVQTIGNTELKPERSKELEGGFEADMLNDRLRLSLTGYRKTTVDALMSVPVAPSVYGGAVTTWRNVGVVRNEGLDASALIQVIQGNAISFSLDAMFSMQRDVMVELGQGVEPFYISNVQRVAPGYPLFGRWAKPILGYADADGNGILDRNEVILGDTAVYVGTTMPNYTATIRPTVSLFRGALSISADISYENGMAQMNEVMRRMAGFSRARFDPTTSLEDQALMVSLGGLGGAGTDYGLIRTVNVLRFRGLSVTYALPTVVARGLGARAMSVSVQGTNLGLKTNYTGIDPSVNGSLTANGVIDNGVLPQPRSWQVRVNASY